MMELRKTSFLYGDKIILAGECKDRTEVHVRNVEDVKKDIFSAINSEKTEDLREAFSQLRISLMSTRDISRIYIQLYPMLIPNGSRFCITTEIMYTLMRL